MINNLNLLKFSLPFSTGRTFGIIRISPSFGCGNFERSSGL